MKGNCSVFVRAIWATSRRRRAFILFRICRKAPREKCSGFAWWKRRKDVRSQGLLHWQAAPKHATTDGYGEQNALSATDQPIEKIIAGIWSDLLGQPQIDPQDNFFALGGQSLLAIQCLSRLREETTGHTFAFRFL